MGAKPLFQAFQAISDSLNVPMLISRDTHDSQITVKSLRRPESHFGNGDCMFNRTEGQVLNLQNPVFAS